MKNKFFSFMLTLCLVVPAMFMMGCNNPAPEEKVVEVNTIEELKTAINKQKDGDKTNDVDVIRLTNDITTETVRLHNISVAFDINGHNITQGIHTSNYDPDLDKFTQMDLTIYDSQKKGIIGSQDTSWGLSVIGNAEGEEHEFVITVKDVNIKGNYSGLGTNGKPNQKDVKVNLENVNCEAFGVGEDGAAAFLTGNHIFNFKNSTFTGLAGIYAKSGITTLDNCTVKGTGAAKDPSHNGNGCNPTGAALDIDSATGYQKRLVVTINGGTYESANTHSVYEFATAKPGETAEKYSTVTIKGQPRYVHPEAAQDYKQLQK